MHMRAFIYARKRVGRSDRLEIRADTRSLTLLLQIAKESRLYVRLNRECAAMIKKDMREITAIIIYTR